MRPKIVILTLVVAVGLVALAAVFKGVMSRNASGTGAQNTTDPSKQAGATTQTAAAKPAGNNGPVTEQQRAEEVEKQLDEIRGLVVEGQGNPAALATLVSKVTHQEPAVRSAALEAVVAMNDTNAIPRLQEAEQVVENPREKVAIMDAIAYLQLPETMPDKPPTNDLATADSTTNQPIVIKRLPGEGKKARAAAARTKRPGQRQTVPGQNQPGQTQGTAPDQNTAPQTVPPQ